MPPILPHEVGTESEAMKKNTTRWALAVGGDFKGPKLAFGQLVYYRVISPDKMQAAAIAGIFAGWQIEAGFRYRYTLPKF